MQTDFSSFRNLIVCVAVSGGKDSMSLLHLFQRQAKQFAITLCAVNCDHAMRPTSANDSFFVAEYCKANSIPLLSFQAKEGVLDSEESARLWRYGCFANASLPMTLTDGSKWQGFDVLATAHHLNDNAETVLFRLARGTSLSGAKGITERVVQKGCFNDPACFPVNALSCKEQNGTFTVVHPLLNVSEQEISAYAEQNEVPFVTDETNLSDAYTRNYIRQHVLPALEEAVPGATQSIHRFSRLACEEDDLLDRLAHALIQNRRSFGYLILPTEEKVLFRRAVRIVLSAYSVKDYTAQQLESLFSLQSAENAKQFRFLQLVACKEEKGIAIFPERLLYKEGEVSLDDYLKSQATDFHGEPLVIQMNQVTFQGKALKFNASLLAEPQAQVRFMRVGDKFTKFGGGTKNLADYFTDLKIPPVVRARIPVIAVGSDIKVVCGVEISDSAKVPSEPCSVAYIVATDYKNL